MQFGVDEAGKGPVLGSMFAAAVLADPATLPDDVGDSKGIRPERRRTLAREIRRVGTVGLAEVPVERIDDPTTDMNTLTVDAHAEALSAVIADDVAGSGTVDDVAGMVGEFAGTVDAGDTDADRFGARVADRLDATISIDARHGADETDPVVGAASIVAKVERDAHVETLVDEYGDVGSGYPSDPTTRAFLGQYVAEHGTLPACARSSWQTCDDVLAAAAQSALGDF